MNNTPLRFVHITDTHVGPTPEHEVMGHRCLPTLEALIEQINGLPFEPDFILHNGDIVDDHSEESYRVARSFLQKLRAPIFYVMGNHDRPAPMQHVLLGKSEAVDRYDYYTEINGVGLAVFDSRGPIDPGGTLAAAQLDTLRNLCQPKGPPLIIALHHQPVPLDIQWLDRGWEDRQMALDCGEAFLDAIRPARERIRGVFFGHVHRSCQVLRDGILFCAPPSACAQIEAWPTNSEPIHALAELPGFNIVTISAEQVVVRQYTFPRP